MCARNGVPVCLQIGRRDEAVERETLPLDDVPQREVLRALAQA